MITLRFRLYNASFTAVYGVKYFFSFQLSPFGVMWLALLFDNDTGTHATIICFKKQCEQVVCVF